MNFVTSSYYTSSGFRYDESDRISLQIGNVVHRTVHSYIFEVLELQRIRFVEGEAEQKQNEFLMKVWSIKQINLKFFYIFRYA